VSDALKRPEEVFHGDHLPEDLKWLMSHFNLPKNDPAIVLIAWHWHRVQQQRDILQDGTLALRAALDSRLEKITTCAATIESLAGSLESLSKVLAEKPLYVSQQIEAELKAPMAASAATCATLVTRLRSLLHHADTVVRGAQRRQALAAFISGLAVGSMLIPWTWQHFFSPH
jgi:hypothetical protein